MVHVRKCICEKGRGKPTTEFYKIVDGKKKPQIYCYGWIDMYNDEPLECCKNCLDWVHGEQCEKDFEEYRAGSEGIKVGDEVTVGGFKGIVVREPYPIGSDNELFVVVWYGQHMSSNSLKNVAPTGRHFPQITEVLEQLKESC